MRLPNWKRFVIIFFISVVFFLPAFAYAQQNSVTISNKRLQIILTIQDAFYTDADKDGSDDDIISYFSISVSTIDEDFKKKNKGVKIKIKVKIIFPSKNHEKHSFSLRLRDGTVNYQLTLLNHALESGWYDLLITIKANQGRNIKGTAMLSFDPPGTGGGDPIAKMDSVD